jgi:tRNA A37 methylthiotransferase MiaB
MSTKEQIYFADLSHTGTTVSANFFPLAIGYVAANLLDKCSDRIEIELFKYPDDLSSALSKLVPRIIGFSNYSWNLNLSYEYIKRIKLKYPKTIIVMGGPNYGLTKEEISDFWARHSLIDFHIVFEGENAMVELFRALESVDFNVDALKAKKTKLPNCHYKYDGQIVEGETLPRIADLGELPSPYIAGLMDKFFDEILIPMISSTRGCPFKCTFCSEGHGYYSRVSKRNNLLDELVYIAERVGMMKDLCLTDANWGMFKEDVSKATMVAEIQDKYDWPRNLIVSSGKNQKKRVLHVTALLKGAMYAGGAMQTTDETILKNIKRSNISLEEMSVKDDKGKNTDDVDSYTELILALPGDNVKTHAKSLRDMVEIGVNKVRMYQLIMLRQTEMNTIETRNKYGLRTRFRLMPRSFGNYEVFGEQFSAVEFEEICVGNNTMSFEEYLDCRELDLTVEILNNGRLFHELIGLCNKFDISWFDVLIGFHERRRTSSIALANIYKDFRDDSVNGIWETRDDLEDSVKSKMDEYLTNDEGTNEMAKGKAKAVFRCLKDIHDLLFFVMETEMEKVGLLDSEMKLYLKELKAYSEYRKLALIDTSTFHTSSFTFDFQAMDKESFVADPHEFRVENPINLVFKHNEDQTNVLGAYVGQYGTSLDGLGRILMRTQFYDLIRIAKSADTSLQFLSTQTN